MTAPFSRALVRPRWSAYACDACRHSQYLSTSAKLNSGHSKWATIKHDKGKKDAAITKQRAGIAHDIAMATKLGGPDPKMNPRLALAVAAAKKGSVPKGVIEAAINRGMGISPTGAALEPIVVEAIFPHGVAVVIDCHTDNKLRMMHAIRDRIRKNNGSEGSVAYLFQKKGVVVFKKKKESEGDEVLNAALEAGVEDIEEHDDGTVVVLTEPSKTKAAADSILALVDLEIEETDIIYDPNEDTMVTLPDEGAAKELGQFLDQLKEVQGVQGVYFNAKQGELEEGVWAELMSRLHI
ncbi:YebC-like protein [Saccharata proteae CBS 121410]|uniref:YebC-like protein n=1 Tax=Saccharata proteae CBS 121410 TaxID=1314787 RepID=A0A9P4HPN4_9PEZI|nr:YebC-like protein [Saccharata proteae CBS 121410]